MKTYRNAYGQRIKAGDVVAYETLSDYCECYVAEEPRPRRYNRLSTMRNTLPLGGEWRLALLPAITKGRQ